MIRSSTYWLSIAPYSVNAEKHLINAETGLMSTSCDIIHPILFSRLQADVWGMSSTGLHSCNRLITRLTAYTQTTSSRTIWTRIYKVCVYKTNQNVTSKCTRKNTSQCHPMNTEHNKAQNHSVIKLPRKLQSVSTLKTEDSLDDMQNCISRRRLYVK